jgi:hypothetical protein
MTESQIAMQNDLLSDVEAVKQLVSKSNPIVGEVIGALSVPIAKLVVSIMLESGQIDVAKQFCDGLLDYCVNLYADMLDVMVDVPPVDFTN